MKLSSFEVPKVYQLVVTLNLGDLIDFKKPVLFNFILNLAGLIDFLVFKSFLLDF